MRQETRNRLLKYGITVAVYAVFVWLFCYTKDFGDLMLREKYRILCDAFTVPGMMSIMVGILLLVSNEGAFDGLGYVFHAAKRALLPGGRFKSERYSDYVERKRGKKVSGFGFLFICGAVAMVIATVFLMLFYQQL